MESDCTVTNPVPATPYFVYVLQVPSGEIKIGIGQDVRQRIRELQTGNHQRIKLAYCLRTSSLAIAQGLEVLLHKRYGGDRLVGEWFQADVTRVIDDLRFALLFAQIANIKTVAEGESGEVIAVPEHRLPPARIDTHPAEEEPEIDDEELYEAAVSLVRALNRAQTQVLQRRLRIGYFVAQGIMDRMEAEGVIGPWRDGMPHEVLPWKRDE